MSLICVLVSRASTIHKKSGIIPFFSKSFRAGPTAKRMKLSRYFLIISILSFKDGPADAISAQESLYKPLSEETSGVFVIFSRF